MRTTEPHFFSKFGPGGFGYGFPLASASASRICWRVAATGSLSGPDIPAQLRTVALAGGQVACPVVPLADRIDQLEAALSTMSPAPPKVDTAALDEKLGLLARARDGGALSESIYDKAKRDLEK